MRIYFAAPWFSPKQAEIHQKVYEILRLSPHDIFSPKHECEVTDESSENDRRRAFVQNLLAIERADLIIAVTDYKDIGTIWECGFAYRANVPITYYAETLGDRPFNLMLAESGIRVVRNGSELYDWLHRITNPGDLAQTKFEGGVE